MSNDGLLDKSWFNRNFWTYSRRWPGYYFAYKAAKSGQLLVFNETTTFGVKVFREMYRLSPEFRPGQGYELFADRNSDDVVLRPSAMSREKGIGFSRKQLPIWSRNIPVRIRGMVLAGERLYVAGPPDIDSTENAARDAICGRKGARFQVVSAGSGECLFGFEMAHVPVFDGLIAAYRRLYMVSRDGAVLCLGNKGVDVTSPEKDK